MRLQDELLDTLAEMVGCDYLSELRRRRYRWALILALEQIPADAYTLFQWLDAACYILWPDRE